MADGDIAETDAEASAATATATASATASATATASASAWLDSKRRPKSECEVNQGGVKVRQGATCSLPTT